MGNEVQEFPREIDHFVITVANILVAFFVALCLLGVWVSLRQGESIEMIKFGGGAAVSGTALAWFVYKQKEIEEKFWDDDQEEANNG